MTKDIKERESEESVDFNFNTAEKVNADDWKKKKKQRRTFLSCVWLDQRDPVTHVW